MGSQICNVYRTCTLTSTVVTAHQHLEENQVASLRLCLPA
jgi:hypothetical protein